MSSADSRVHRINPWNLEACSINRCASNDDDRHLAFSIKKYIYGPGWSWYGERSLRKLVVVVVRWETQVRREGRRMGMRTQPRESMLNFVCPRSHELDLVQRLICPLTTMAFQLTHKTYRISNTSLSRLILGWIDARGLTASILPTDSRLAIPRLIKNVRQANCLASP